jgi:hypothetical protein
MPLHIDTSGNGPGPDRGPGGGSPWSSPSRRRSRVTEIGSEFLAAIRKAFVVFGPVPPRTIVANGTQALGISAERDSTTSTTSTTGATSTASTAFVVRNRQSATVVVSPALGLLCGPEGVRWTPEHSIRVTQRLLSTGATTEVEFDVVIPSDVPLGRYEGVLVWPGLVGATPLVIDVRDRSAP